MGCNSGNKVHASLCKNLGEKVGRGKQEEEEEKEGRRRWRRGEEEEKEEINKEVRLRLPVFKKSLCCLFLQYMLTGFLLGSCQWTRTHCNSLHSLFSFPPAKTLSVLRVLKHLSLTGETRLKQMNSLTARFICREKSYSDETISLHCMIHTAGEAHSYGERIENSFLLF